MAQPYKKATKKAAYESKVAQLDTLGTGFEEFLQQESLTVVEDICGQFIERVKGNIETEKLPVTGKISDITIETKDNQVQISAHPWLIYQDRGVSGTDTKRPNTPHAYTDKMPPVQVFEDYIREKNIQLRDEEQFYEDGSPFKELTEDDKIKSAAWGMAMNVKKHGFKSRPVFSKEIPKLVEDLSNEIADFAVQSIFQMIDVQNPATNRVTK
jgi:hypothetical protein